MKLLEVTLAVLGLSATTLGAAVPKKIDGVIQTDYDAIIVGGGPAGLSALSGLARVRRKVLLIDSGRYRNEQTRHAHDLLGFDGVTPAWYRYSARKQIATYDTIEMTNGTVTKIEPSKNNTYFTVMAELPGEKAKAMTARKIVLATGLRDDLPSTPGLQENFGKGIYWCPWCDGHEHADQALGLLGPLKSVTSSVREMLTLNTDIMAFVNGTDTPANREVANKAEPDFEIYLQANNVTVDNRAIKAIVRLKDGESHDADPSAPSVPEHDLFRIDFEDGPSVERNAFLGSFPELQASNVGREMGVEIVGESEGKAKMLVDASKGLMTKIPGVYAVGDANSDNSTNIPHALFSGKRTAVFLHVAIGREDQTAQIKMYKAEHKSGKRSPTGIFERAASFLEGFLPQEIQSEKRSEEETARSLWESVNGQPGDVLYAGEYDQ